MKEGLIWRVGDGSNINIWKDLWLNRDGAKQPITPRRQCLLTNVAEMINPITGQWDEQLVRQKIWEMDAEIILSTPIRADFEDYPAWFHDSKGIFSVKSAYKIYVKQRDAKVSSSSVDTKVHSFWKQIWDLSCLPKVKQFMWRLTHNSLPLRTNISRRGIRCDTLCACCKRLDEDGAHFFLKCKETREAWRSLGLGEICDRMVTYEHADNVVQENLNINNDKQKILSCCLLWRCWLRWNKLNAREKAPTVREVIRQARYWAAESEVLCKQEKIPIVDKPIHRWTKPKGDIIKINIDGSFDADGRSGRWGSHWWKKGLPFDTFVSNQIRSATKGLISPGSYENVGQGALVPVQKGPSVPVSSNSR
jgi:hypothetical protein